MIANMFIHLLQQASGEEAAKFEMKNVTETDCGEGMFRSACHVQLVITLPDTNAYVLSVNKASNTLELLERGNNNRCRTDTLFTITHSDECV